MAIHDPPGVKLLTKLWLQLSHFNEHKFCHNFKDFVSHVIVVLKQKQPVTFSSVANFFANERPKINDGIRCLS